MRTDQRLHAADVLIGCFIHPRLYRDACGRDVRPHAKLPADRLWSSCL
jgi:hypothetical protein